MAYFDHAYIVLACAHIGTVRNASSVADETSDHQVPIERSPASYRTQARKARRNSIKAYRVLNHTKQLCLTSPLGNRQGIPSMPRLVCSLADGVSL
jgi:hypothetical protein